MSKNFEFVVVESPAVKKVVKITVGGKGQGKNLDLEWRGMSRKAAAQALVLLEVAAATYCEDTDEGVVSLKHSEAIDSWVTLNSNDGPINVPQLHDGVFERDLNSVIRSRDAAFQALITGDASVLEDDAIFDGALAAMMPGELDGDSVLDNWTLVDEGGEVMNHCDPEIYELVFSNNEFFFPVWDSLVEALGEMARGREKEKNSKTTVSSSRNRKGKFRA